MEKEIETYIKQIYENEKIQIDFNLKECYIIIYNCKQSSIYLSHLIQIAKILQTNNIQWEYIPEYIAEYELISPFHKSTDSYIKLKW